MHTHVPSRPLGVIMGGAKVADKIGVMWSLIQQADIIMVGACRLPAAALLARVLLVSCGCGGGCVCAHVCVGQTYSVWGAGERGSRGQYT